jgi:hypothetical protein
MNLWVKKFVLFAKSAGFNSCDSCNSWIKKKIVD